MSLSYNNPFQRDTQPTASISIATTGGGITHKHARALKFLIAAAVTGLSPEDVSVIDSQTGLIGAAEEVPDNATDDRADTLRQRVQRLLEARVGAGNAVVEVSVETVTKIESLRERRIDPESRVAISSDTEERSNTASDQGGGDVTVASNLPDGDAAGGDTSSSQTSETRERINYEVSETERQITLAPGAIKRLSVAVLVNGTTEPDASGNATFQPRSEEELEALRDLVSSAVGYDEARGDVITLKTMQFQSVEPVGTIAEASFLGSMAFDLKSLIQTAVLAVVALILGLFVVRPVLAGSTARRENVPLAIAPAPGGRGAVDENTPAEALTGEIDDRNLPADGLAVVSGPEGQGETGGAAALIASDQAGPDPVERLRALIGERQEETVEILRSWLEGEEENA